MERLVVIQIAEENQELKVFTRKGKMVVITLDDIYLLEEPTDFTPKRKVPPPELLEQIRRRRHRVRRRLEF